VPEDLAGAVHPVLAWVLAARDAAADHRGQLSVSGGYAM
jgi:hypothetical protein